METLQIPKTAQMDEAYDIREFGQLVYPCRNQSRCGSCTAFACVATVEALLQRLHGLEINEPLLSPQQIIDLVYPGSGNSGCLGCWPSTAFHIMEVQGVAYEADYPYTGVQNCTRAFQPRPRPSITIFNHHRIKIDEQIMMDRLRAMGAFVVVIPVTDQFDSYQGPGLATLGAIASYSTVFDTPPSAYLHSMTLIAFGPAQPCHEEPFWVFRNSYGPLWGGEEAGGHVKIRRSQTPLFVEAWGVTRAYIN